MKAKELENAAKLLGGEDFERKNKNLKRPISPHLSIHTPWSNMIISMTHRFTGTFLYVIPFGLATGENSLPAMFN